MVFRVRIVTNNPSIRIIWAWFRSIHSADIFRLLMTSPSQGLTGNERWRVKFCSAEVKKSGEVVGCFCSFLLIMKMNVTGLLRVELLCFKNYWTITSLWLKCASWLFNFSDFKLGLFSIMCSTDLLFVVTLKVIEAKLSRSNKRKFNSAIKHFFYFLRC